MQRAANENAAGLRRICKRSLQPKNRKIWSAKKTDPADMPKNIFVMLRNAVFLLVNSHFLPPIVILKETEPILNSKSSYFRYDSSFTGENQLKELEQISSYFRSRFVGFFRKLPKSHGLS